jgi:hypothetical protein
MSTRVRVSHSDVGDAFYAHGVIERAVVAEDAAMPVGCVFAETDVCYDEELWKVTTDQLYTLDDRTGRVIGGGAESVFGVGGKGDTEEDDGSKALGDKGSQERNEFVET